MIDSPGGQASSQFEMPFSPLELENFLLKVGMSLSDIRRNVRRVDSSDMAEIKAFGSRLFRAVFDEQLRPTLVRSLDEARRRQTGLRLRLRLSGAPELADCPWEYLYDTRPTGSSICRWKPPSSDTLSCRNRGVHLPSSLRSRCWS